VGMPLKYLNLAGLPVADVTQLKDMFTLKTLVLDDTPITDLSPLAKLSLTSLRIENTQVVDFTPLTDMPLKELRFSPPSMGEGVQALRSLENLEQINGVPAATFWRERDAADATQ
jgi:Leucine-rich repeat (LRR) protein